MGKIAILDKMSEITPAATQKRKVHIIRNCLIKPIKEELIFRGALQTLIKQAIIHFLPSYIKVAANIAILISGICFGLDHLKQSKTEALLDGISGCLIEGPLMEKYGLLTSMGAHIISNTVVDGILLSMNIIITIL